MRATPINEAEAIFERFYDPLRSGFPRWTVAPDPATGAKAWQNWCGVVVDWNTGGGRTVATLTATPRLELEQYDHLMLRLSFPTTARMNVWGIIDGERTRIIADARGENNVSEFSGSVHGRCLESLQLEIRDDGSVPASAMLLWIGLFEEQRQRRMHARAAAAFDGWGDLLLPPEQVIEQPAPLLGVFFGGEDLDALRRKAASPPYAPLMEGLRGIARSHLRNEPWKQVAQFTSPYGPDLLGRTPQNLDTIAMRICAFVGLLDRDPALLRMALNHALAAAHCEYWCDSFLSTMPGTTWEHRGFIAFGVTTSVVFAWDWAGSYLTPAGREVLAQAVAIKGLPWIQLALRRWSYMRGCNQGAFHAFGALVAEAALARAWPPHGGEGIEVARAAMDQTMNGYVAADGGAFEGPIYYEATLSATLVGYAAYARLKGLPLAQVVPPGLANAGRYLVAMLSTAGPPGSFVNVGDGGRPEHTLMPDALASLEAFGNDPDVAALIATILPTAHLRETNRVFPGSAFNIILGPSTLPPAAVKPPVFALLPDTGMLCSCRPTPHGPVRLQVVGAPANAGHSHDDKGSFILEAFGEEIAIDRGQMTYEDPRAGVIGYAVYHNLLIPHLPDGVLTRQVNPCPQAIIPAGSGDERSLHARIDAGAAYPGLVEAWNRSFDSDEPMEFTITDDLRLTKPMAAGFHVHSRYPWTKTREGWVTRGQAAELLVTPDWTPSAETGCEDFIDGLRKPAHHLALISPSASEHYLRTRLRVRPVK